MITKNLDFSQKAHFLNEVEVLDIFSTSANMKKMKIALYGGSNESSYSKSIKL